MLVYQRVHRIDCVVHAVYPSALHSSVQDVTPWQRLKLKPATSQWDEIIPTKKLWMATIPTK